jgi:hypothetical protein
VERIFQGINYQDEGPENTNRELYHRVELVKAIESDEQEVLMLADGNPSQIEAIKKLTTKNYYGLMEFILKKRKEKSGRDSNQI